MNADLFAALDRGQLARVAETDVRAGRAGMSESPCLGCNAIETHPVTLDSGHVVCSSCEAYRHECEVRAVVGMPGQRRTYLEGVAKQRGPAAARRLEQDVRDELARLKTNGGRTA